MNCFISILFVFSGFLSWSSPSHARVESETNLVPPQEKLKEVKDAGLNKPDPQAIPPPEGRYPATLVQLSDSDSFSPYAFLVDKSTRTLTVWRFQNGEISLVAYYPSDLGRQSGNKQSLGDFKTPEGIYFFQNRYEGKQIERGSRGCIVVRDEVIQKVGEFISLKHTPIVIQEKIEYVEPQVQRTTMAQLNSWLENWRKSWETKDINTYISYYGDQFKSLGMNRSGWKRFKENLNSRYQSIQVQTRDPMIVVHENEAIIKFLQSYQSDMKSDFGEKTLYLKKDDQGQLKIVGEEWSETLKKKISASEIKGFSDSL
ncbi:MAG: hypothetical protein IPK68_03760 [Bdellovibrionales bacterium]|nr:hypothetical protein [Bdellovibrionales bacterium]